MTSHRVSSAQKQVAEAKPEPKPPGSTSSAPVGSARKRKSAERNSLSIGEVARQANVSTRTIRYYEELGILRPPERTTNGSRRYPRDYIFHVEGARILKQLGFGLEEIAELGKFALTGASASSRTQAILKGKLSDLEHRIGLLNRLFELVNEAVNSPREPQAGTATPELLRWVGEGTVGQNS